MGKSVDDTVLSLKKTKSQGIPRDLGIRLRLNRLLQFRLRNGFTKRTELVQLAENFHLN